MLKEEYTKALPDINPRAKILLRRLNEICTEKVTFELDVEGQVGFHKAEKKAK